MAVIGLYLSFAIPIFLRWKHGDRFEPGSWNNGSKYKWMNLVAVAEIVIISIYFILPLYPSGWPGNENFEWKFVNYAPILTFGTLVVVTVWWFASARALVHRPEAHHRRGGGPGFRRIGPRGPPTTISGLLDQVPVLATRTSVEELSGGLTNRNVKITTPGGIYVAGCPSATRDCSGSTGTPSTSTPARPPRRASGPRWSTTGRTSGMLVITFLRGPGPRRTTPFTDPGVLPRGGRRLSSAARRTAVHG